jgi:hypothetical protein
VQIDAEKPEIKEHQRHLDGHDWQAPMTAMSRDPVAIPAISWS